jgi:hypothetical protein
VLFLDAKRKRREPNFGHTHVRVRELRASSLYSYAFDCLECNTTCREELVLLSKAFFLFKYRCFKDMKFYIYKENFRKSVCKCKRSIMAFEFTARLVFQETRTLCGRYDEEMTWDKKCFFKSPQKNSQSPRRETLLWNKKISFVTTSCWSTTPSVQESFVARCVRKREESNDIPFVIRISEALFGQTVGRGMKNGRLVVSSVFEWLDCWLRWMLDGVSRFLGRVKGTGCSCLSRTAR